MDQPSTLTTLTSALPNNQIRNAQWLYSQGEVETLNLSRTSIISSGLQHIVRLPELRALNLNRCQRIKDDELKSLSAATSLKEISPDGTAGHWQSDECWQATLRGPFFVSLAVQNLSWLNLSGNKISDRALEAIIRLNELGIVYLDRTTVTGNGMFGVGFTSIDGHHLELDDEFAFSMHEPLEAWEEQQREYADFPAQCDRDREGRERKIAAGEIDDADEFAWAWSGGMTTIRCQETQMAT